MTTKTFSVKIEPKGKALGLHEYVTKQLEQDAKCKPLDAILNLLNGFGNKGEKTNQPDMPLLANLELDNESKLEGYGNKTEASLVNDCFLNEDGSVNIGFIKRCVLAQAKSEYSRSKNSSWSNKVDKQALIHSAVQQQMSSNNTSKYWFEKQSINAKWISVNCNTSMLKAQEYLAKNKIVMNEHNQSVQTVNGKCLGAYFNRSAKAEKRKHQGKLLDNAQVLETSNSKQTLEADSINIELNQLDDEPILGADGQIL